MFGTFRKHSTWLWGIIIAAMAVSLVWWTGNQGTGSGADGSGNYGWVAGKQVTREAINHAAQEARLQYFVSRGSWPGQDAERMGFDLNLEAYKRLFIIQKQEELGIHVSTEQLARVAAENLKALSRNGAPVTMAMFEQNVLKPGGISLDDYERFLRHQLGMQQMVAAVTVSGKLVTEKEARAMFVRENQERSVQAVFFSLSNHLDSVKSTPEALTLFYSNQLARYRVPERIQVSYVGFKATNYWDDAGTDMARMTNQAGVSEVVRKYGLQAQLAGMSDISAIIDALYSSRGGTNFYTELTPEKAKEGIRGELHEQMALMNAARRANEFADPILSADTIRADMLAARAKELGVSLQVSEPFDRSSAPEGMNVSERFVRAAFNLNDYQPVSDPLMERDAVYIIARHKDIPSEVPPYDQIKDLVALDYRQSEAVRAAREAAGTFVQSATNAIAQGSAFASACSEAKVSPVLLPPFSLNTPSLPEVEQHMSLQQFKQIAFGIKVGEVSQVVRTMEGAVVAFVQSELPLDEQKVNAELPAFVKLLRQARQQEAFEDWFNREASRALAHTPVAGPRPSEVNQPGTAN